MNNNRWREIERIFDETLELSEADRDAFIAQACNGDQTLQREVESLLAAHQEANGFLVASATRLSPVQELSTTVIAAQRLGPYQLLREIAQGGMGTVWLAERADDQFKQQVAIKLLKAGAHNPNIAQRLRHERQILADLNHPNIARLLDGGTTDSGQPYLVMEYIEGVPIDAYCQQQQLGLRERLQLFRQVCAAVAYAHQHLIIHRDLKPANILVTADGTPKLLDFGIAKLLQPDLSQSYQTQAGQTPMTPAYASPEQVRGEKLATTSDVYSLGVVLYELLTGRSPYQLTTNTFGELAKAICEQEPTRPSMVTKSEVRSQKSEGKRKFAFLPTTDHRPPTTALRGDLDSIVLMALRKEPTARYASVEQFSADIQRYLDGLPTLARKGTLAYRTVKYVRRHKVPVAAAALIALSLLGGIGATSRQAQIARAEQAKANAERIRAEQALAVADEQRRRAEQALAEVEAQRTRAENALTTAEQRRQQADAARTEANQQRAVAEAQRLAAEAERNVAQTQRQRAEQGEQTQRQFLYSAQMKLAQQAWDAGNIERMQELLDAQLPPAGQQDLRGFEWYYLWRLAHAEVATLKHTDEVVAIVQTPDGAQMASQTLGGDIRIWETATGQERAPIHDAETNATCLAISPDGRFLAQGKNNGKVKIFAAATGATLATLDGSQPSIRTLAFAPDGSALAVGAMDGTVSVWAVPTWKQQTSFKASARRIDVVVFTPDSKQLLTGGSEGVVKVWHPLSGQELKTLPKVAGVYEMAFIPHSNNLVIAYWDATIRVSDFATGRQLGAVGGSLAGGALACSPDGSLLAISSSFDVRVLNARNLTTLFTLKSHSSAVRSLAFTPDSKGLFTGSADRTLKLFNLQENPESKILAYNPIRVDNVAFTRDGNRLISGDDAQMVRMHDLAGRELQKLEGHQRSQTADDDPLAMVKVAVSPDGRYFATSGHDGTVRTWEERTGKPLHVFKGHTRSLFAVAISPDSRYIASGGNDLMVKVWDAASGQELHSMRGHSKLISGAAFAPQGNYLATSSEDGTLILWDYVNGKALRTIRPYTSRIANLAFSPDGKWLALGGNDRYITLLETTTWRTVKTLKGHGQSPAALRFSPDGKRLASAGLDSTTRIWELEQGQEVLTLRGHRGNNMDMAFSPDGTMLVTAGGDGKLLLWPTATPREVMARTSTAPQPLRANVSADAVRSLLARQPVTATSTTTPLQIADQKITGWTKGGGVAREMYAALMDTSVSLSNKASAVLVSKTPDLQSFGTIAQTIRADHYRGKRVRFSGYLKGLEVGKPAALWFRADGVGIPSLEFGNTTKPIATDWMKYEVVLNVPDDALTLQFGFILNGSGQVWGDDFRLEIVDADVPVTGLRNSREQSERLFMQRPEADRARIIQQAQEIAKRLPLQPVNLDFEQ